MEHLEEYKALQKQIQDLDMAGKYQELLDYTVRYVELADQLFGKEHSQYATALNEYAGAYRNLGEYQKAEGIYLEALNVMERSLGRNTFEYATILNNLAGMYRLSKQYEKSEKAFLDVKYLYASTIGETHFLYISGLNNLGLLYQDMGDYKKAVQLHQDCLDIFDTMEKKSDVAIATTLVNLASAKMGDKQMDDVETLLRQSMRMYEATIGKVHPLYAHALNSLAGYYTVTEDFREAEKCLKESLELVAVAYGEESHSYALVHRNLEAVQQILASDEK